LYQRLIATFQRFISSTAAACSTILSRLRQESHAAESNVDQATDDYTVALSEVQV
jgi:hypothetical protein